MKTKMTKLLSLLVAMSMLLGIFTAINVSAADKGIVEGLYVDYSGTSTVDYATDYAYTGTRSLKIDAQANGGVWIGDPVGDFGMQVAPAAYGIEFYVYVDSWTSGKLWLRPGPNSNGTYPTVYWASLNYSAEKGLYLGDTNSGRWTIEASDKTGWYKVRNLTPIVSEKGFATGTNGTGNPGYMWHVEASSSNDLSVRIDDIKVYNWTTPTTTQNQGNAVGSPIAVRDFEPEQVEIPEIELEPVTELYNTYSNDSKIGYATDSTGDRALKIEAVNGGGIWVGDPVADFGMQVAPAAYGIEFEIHVDSWTSGKLWLRPGPNNNDTFPTVYYAYLDYSAENGLYLDGTNKGRWTIEAGSRTGWYKVRNLTPIVSEKGFASASIGGKPGHMWMVESDSDFSVRIDNIKAYNWSTPSTTQNTGNVVGEPFKVIDFTTAQEPEATPTPAPASYSMAKNLIAAHVAAGTVSVSWRNPADPVAQQIKLYDVSTGRDVLLKDDFATTASGINEYLDATAVAGASKIYRVDFIYADGAVKSQTVGTEVATGNGWAYDAAQWHFGSSTANKEPARMSVDDKVYKTAAPSIHISSNDTTWNTGNAVLTLTMEGTLKAGTYELSFYRKMTNSEYVTGDTSLNTVNNRLYPTDSSTTGGSWSADSMHNCDWLQYSKTYTISSDIENPTILRMTFNGKSEDFWIDDVSLRKVENGTPAGDNLLGAIGTVSDVTAAPAAPTAAEADTTGVYEEATLTWSVGSDAKYVAIYNKGEEDIPLAYIPVDFGYVDMKNLIAGRAYTFTVKTVNAEGRESATGFDVTVTPNATPTVIGDFKTTKTGNDVTVSIDIKNNSAGSNVTAQLIMATYYDDTLQTFKATDVTTIPETAISAAPVTLSETITVPSGYTMVMYLWDSLSGMRPLIPSKTY